jgi:8-oxo-dGTP pyrophosphatase MutT (NUDIX family)
MASAATLKLKVQVWIHCADRVLILRTHARRGGFWQPVTGSVDPGEPLEGAALREACEETGLEFLEAPRPLGFSFRFTSRFGPAEEHVFTLVAPESPTRSWPEVRTDPSEHDEARWVLPDEALGLMRFESNRKALEIWLGASKRKV